MWYLKALRRGATYNNPSVSACLQFLACNRINNITLRCPARRLSVSNEHERTIGEVIDQWSCRFKAEGIPEPMESIERIVAHVTGIKKITDGSNIRKDRLNARQIVKLESICECRLSRMPLQYIIGEWDFRDIVVKLVPPIFIPWPETEMLVDVVLKRLNASQDESCEILEIGCGSGAISLSLAHTCKKMRCIAIDMNSHACELTMANRDRLNLTHQIAVMHATLKPDARIEISGNLNGTDNVDLNSKSFDFIVSNPPYIPTKKLSELEPEMKIYEDLMALDGGDDGLEIIKRVLKYSAQALKPGGRLFMEVYPAHPEYIQFFTKKYSDLKLRYEHTYKDLCNYDRFVEIVKVV